MSKQIKSSTNPPISQALRTTPSAQLFEGVKRRRACLQVPVVVANLFQHRAGAPVLEQGDGAGRVDDGVGFLDLAYVRDGVELPAIHHLVKHGNPRGVAQARER